MSGAPPPQGWAREAERGSRAGLAAMAWIGLTLGRPVARLALPFIAAYFTLAGGAAQRHATRFLGRALGRAPTFADRFRLTHRFAAVALDRLWLARGELRRFDLDVHGAEWLDVAVADGRGLVLLGAHLGSFEALHAVGSQRPGVRVAMAMYPDNARMVQQVLAAVAPEASLDVIAIGRPESTLVIRDWLASGGLVGMLGDRFLASEAQARPTAKPFLGTPAPFSAAPLKLAALLRQRVVFMVGLYHGGARYEVRFEPLADFSRPFAKVAERERAVDAALDAYVARLDTLARAHPFNWFNFHDFWLDETAAAGAPNAPR